MEGHAIILFAILMPLLGGITLLFMRQSPNMREACTLISAILTFLSVVKIYILFQKSGDIYVTLFDMAPGLSIAFRVEPLGMLFACIASFLWIITSIYSIGYMRGHHEKNQTRFYFFFAFAIFATLGIAFSGNMITLFLFYEILTVGTFPLVAHSGAKAAKSGGRTYLGILIFTSVLLQLPAIIVTWFIAGTLDFIPGGILRGYLSPLSLMGLLALYSWGIGKAALMPFHRWLPAAMVAPTPVSALLHAVAVVKAGVFSIVKVVIYIFGVDFLSEMGGTHWLIGMAAFTIIVASTVAIFQDNLKKRLAWSTISQLSYVIIATAMVTPLTQMAASVHIAAHAFGKITLFFAAGAIMVASHKTKVSELNGIGYRMPLTMAAFSIGVLSMIGLPPTIGFISKWYILKGAFEGGYLFVLSVMLVSTLLNAGYFLPILYRAFMVKEKAEGAASVIHDHGEAPLPCCIALFVTASGTVLFFFMPGMLLNLARQLM